MHCGSPTYTCVTKNAVLLLLTLLAACQLYARSMVDADFSRGCTVFTISKGGQVFFGGNDDFIEPDSYYWVDPGGDGAYGAIWIGRPENVQQGVNEAGLAYDANGLPRVSARPHQERLPVPGGYNSHPIHILRACATVAEVIDWVQAHQRPPYMHDQMQFADAGGDAVIISAGTDGELVFTRKPAGDGFLVSTNFNVANPANGYGYPCWRFDRARERLRRLLLREGPLTARDAAGVLDAVHVEGGGSWTIESLVVDLVNMRMYIYYFYQFNQPVVLDVHGEIANPRAPGPISLLFPQTVRQEASRRFRAIQRKSARCRWAAILWLGLVAAGLVLFLALAGPGRGRRFWVPAGVIIGPLAVLVYLLAGRGRIYSRRRAALVETTGDLMPAVAAFIAIMVIVLLVPAVQSNPIMQLLSFLVLPLLVALIVFHAPFLAAVSGRGYGRALLERLPQVLVVSNLAMAGITLTGMPMAQLALRACAVFPFNVWTVPIYWCLTVPGALIAGSLVFLYERWAVTRGYRAWIVVSRRDGQVRTPSWRRLGWWLPVSYLVLFTASAAGAVLSRTIGALTTPV